MTDAQETTPKSLLDPTIAIGGLIIAAITFMMTYTPSELATKLLPWRSQLTWGAGIALVAGVFWLGRWTGKRSVKPVVQEVIREVEVEVPGAVEDDGDPKKRPIAELTYAAKEIVTLVCDDNELLERRIRLMMQRFEREHAAWHDDGVREARNDFVSAVKAALRDRNKRRGQYASTSLAVPASDETKAALSEARDVVVERLDALQEQWTTNLKRRTAEIPYRRNGVY